MAEIAHQYLAKGRLVFIEGRLNTRTWQDQSGQKRNRTEIIAENMQLGPRFASAPNPPQTPLQNVPEPVVLPEVQLEDIGEAPMETSKEDEEIKVENIPF